MMLEQFFVPMMLKQNFVLEETSSAPRPIADDERARKRRHVSDDNTPRCLYAWFKAMRRTKGNATRHKYVRTLKRILEAENIGLEYAASATFLREVKARPADKRGKGLMSATVKAFGAFYAQQSTSESEVRYPALPKRFASEEDARLFGDTQDGSLRHQARPMRRRDQGEVQGRAKGQSVE